jgi:DNA-binding NtrC family response regulator
VCTFFDARSCARNLDKSTNVLISDPSIAGVSTVNLLSDIQRSHRRLTVVIHSTSAEVIDRVEAVISCKYITTPVFPVFRYSQVAKLK